MADPVKAGCADSADVATAKDGTATGVMTGASVAIADKICPAGASGDFGAVIDVRRAELDAARTSCTA